MRRWLGLYVTIHKVQVLVFWHSADIRNMSSFAAVSTDNSSPAVTFGMAFDSAGMAGDRCPIRVSLQLSEWPLAGVGN